MSKKILIALGSLYLLCWLCFTLYTCIMLFGVEVDVKCVVADQSGTMLDVAYRFNTLLILFFSAQIGIMVSFIVLCVKSEEFYVKIAQITLVGSILLLIVANFH